MINLKILGVPWLKQRGFIQLLQLVEIELDNFLYLVGPLPIWQEFAFLVRLRNFCSMQHQVTNLEDFVLDLKIEVTGYLVLVCCHLDVCPLLNSSIRSKFRSHFSKLVCSLQFATHVEGTLILIGITILVPKARLKGVSPVEILDVIRYTQST